MDAHYSVELPQAFVVGEGELKKLAELLSDRIGDVEIHADCADDVCRMFKNVKELAAFENAKGKEVCRLRLYARSGDFKKRATIDLSDSRWRGISLDFEARDDVVSRLHTDVLDLVGGMCPWYALLHRVNFVVVAFIAYLVLWFGVLLAVAFQWVSLDGSKGQTPSSSALGQLVVFGGIAVLFGVGIVLNRFRDVVFPRSVFLIGQGNARFQHLQRCQWGIVIAFIVSLAAGIVIAVWQAIAS
jgi:hypothetical protein